MTRPSALLSAALCAAVSAANLAPVAAQCGDFEVTPVVTGSEWKRSFLYDVSALAPDDAWAVGFYDVPDGSPGSDTLSLAMHWDGTSWTQVPTQNPSPYPGGTAVYLRGVAALAPDDVWAGGERHGDAGGLSVGAWIHVQHWDGSSWEEVDVPQPPRGAGINFSGTRIYEVVGFESDDVWFGGAWAHPNEIATVTWRPLAMHWDGSSMDIVDTPVILDGTTSFGYGVRSFAALGPDDIYAMCTPNTASQVSYQNVVLHYDGSDWTRLDVPDAPASHVLSEIVAIASDDIWLFGRYYFPSEPYALHWDGSSWTEVSGSPFLAAATATGPDTIYTGSAGISIFDGSTSTLVDDLAEANGPSVLAMRAAGECSVWAVGRQSIGGKLLPLAARLEGGTNSSPWTPLGGGITASNGKLAPLAGSGSLSAGSPAALTLSDAMPTLATTLVVGFSELHAPFKGGVLVPTPDLLLPGVMTDGDGNWRLEVEWPAGVPAGTSVSFQAWMPDPSAPAGFAASDGLRATQP